MKQGYLPESGYQEVPRGTLEVPWSLDMDPGGTLEPGYGPWRLYMDPWSPVYGCIWTPGTLYMAVYRALELPEACI